jgi:hypothetical protein
MRAEVYDHNNHQFPHIKTTKNYITLHNIDHAFVQTQYLALLLIIFYTFIFYNPLPTSTQTHLK